MRIPRTIFAVAAAAVLVCVPAFCGEGIRPPEPEFAELSVGIWPAEEVDLDEIKPLGLNSVKVFTGVPRDLKGVRLFALVDGWDDMLAEEGGAAAFAAALKSFVAGGGTLVVFPPEMPEEMPKVLPVEVSWGEFEDEAPGGRDEFPVEFVEPDHPVVKEVGYIEGAELKMTVGKAARVIVTDARAKTPVIAVADAGKGHVVLFAFSVMSLEDLLLLRSICLWAAGKTKEPGPDSDRRRLAGEHLARGLGGLALMDWGGFDMAPAEEAAMAELAKARPLTAALTSLVLDDERPAWRRGTEHAGWQAVEAVVSALGSDDPAARSGARWALMVLAPIAYGPLKDAAASGNALARAGAEEALQLYRSVVYSGWDEPGAIVEELVEQAQYSIRDIREQLGITEPVEKLVEWLRSPDPKRATWAAEELGRTGDPRALDALIAALGAAADRELKRELVKSLAALGGARAIEAIGKAVAKETAVGEVFALCSHIARGGDPAAEAVLMSAVSRAGWSDEDLQRLLQLAGYCRRDVPWRRTLLRRALESENRNLRMTAVRYVGRWDGPDVLVALLDDPDMAVRGAAVAQLAGRFRRTHAAACHRAYVKILKEKELPDEVLRSLSGVSYLYATAGGAGFIPEAASAVRPWLERATPPVQLIGQLAYIRHQSLVAPLVKLLDHANLGVRQASAAVLTRWAMPAGYRPTGGGLPELKDWIKAHPGFVGGEEPRDGDAVF